MRIVAGGVAAGFAMFMWGFVFWGLLPITPSILHPVTDEEALQQALAENLPETGSYMVPYPPDTTEGEEYDAFEQRQTTGPVAQIFVRRDGASVMGPGMMVTGLLHMVASALIMAGLLNWAGSAFSAYSQRLVFVAVAGTAGSFFAKFSPPIWFYHPWEFHIADFLYLVIGWVIAGAILAAIVKPAAPGNAPVAKSAAMDAAA